MKFIKESYKIRNRLGLVIALLFFYLENEEKYEYSDNNSFKYRSYIRGCK